MLNFNNIKYYVKIIFMFSVTGFIFYQLFSLIELELIHKMINRIEKINIFIFLLLSCIVSFLTSIRFSIALKIINFRLNVFESWSYILAVAPFNLFIPSKGGEFGKAYLLRDKVEYSGTIGSVIVEKYFDVIVLITIGLIGAIYIKYLLLISFFSIVLISLLLIPVLLSKIKLKKRSKIFNKLINILGIFHKVSKKPKIAILLFFSSFLIWISFTILIYLIFLSVDYVPEFSVIMTVYPLSIIVGLVPVTFSGLGTRDAAFVFLFGLFDISEELALIVSLFYFLFSYILPSILGIPFAMVYFPRRLNSNNN